MKKLALLLVLAVLLFSCKTTRYNIKETTKTETSVQKDIREESTVKETVLTAENIASLTEELTSIIERIITVKLSAPDSLLNQYPVEVTTTEREYTKQRVESTKARKDESTNVESKVQKTDNSTETSKTESVKIDKTKTTLATPAWVIVGVVILCVGVLVLVYFILKRYRIL